MADNLAALLANAAQTNADFDFGKLNKSYWEGLEQAYKQKQRSLFEGGAPTKDDGTIDWDKVSSRTLQAGGVPALGELTTLQKVMTDMGIKAGLGGMSNNVFGGPGAAPAAPPSAAPSRLVSPSVSGSSGAVADDNMEIPPRTIAAANAPPAARPAPAQPAAPPAAAQPAPTQLPPPPPVSPLVPRPVQTTPITPPQMAPQSVPLPPPRPVMAQAPAAPPQAAVQQAPPPQPPVQQPPPQAGSPQAAGMSPATEAALHAAGLVPEGRSVAQHVNLLQRAAALANSSGVRDAGKPYNDALNNIAKFIEQRSAPTDTQKDYELEVRQGYKGSFNDYQNMQQGQKLRFAVDQDTMKEIGTQAAQMVRIRPLLDEALRLSEKSYAGYAGKVAPYWAKVVSAFGINPGEMAWRL